MRCEDVRAAHLAGAQADAGEAHLRTCGPCRLALGDLDAVAARLTDPAIWEEPDGGMLARVSASLPGGGARPRPSATAGARGRLWPALAAVAAAVGLVVAATVQLSRTDEPDWRIALVPTAAAPGARATVAGWVEESGTRMELAVEGLPPADGDDHYALWLTAPDGRHVAAGTFTGDGTVQTWAGVSRADFPRLWVTLEPGDGDESLSGTSVLDTPGP